MEHRGIEYKILQTIEGGYRWVVQIGKREKYGFNSNRQMAVHYATQCINSEIQKRRSKQPLALPPIATG